MKFVRQSVLLMAGLHRFAKRIIVSKITFNVLMQARVQQKLSGSSFVGGYISGISTGHSARLTVINTQILHWRGFDARVPACLRT